MWIIFSGIFDSPYLPLHVDSFYYIGFMGKVDILQTPSLSLVDPHGL